MKAFWGRGMLPARCPQRGTDNDDNYEDDEDYEDNEDYEDDD